MTYYDFITLLKQPEIVTADHVADLKEIVERYPYFAPAQLFYTKALQQSNNLHFGAYLKMAVLYTSSRRWLYYYLHPEKLLSSQPYRNERNGKFSGDYFDILNLVESEGGDTKKSLKKLAERLKSARVMIVKTAVQTKKKNNDINDLKAEKAIITKMSLSESYFPLNELDISEFNAKKLIKERNYKEAIEILRQLNLNNPKKSVYFADQIRFLEKVITNSKK